MRFVTNLRGVREGDLLLPRKVKMGAMRLHPALLLVAAVAACSLLEEPKSDFRVRATEELHRHQAIWDSLAIQDYDFSYAKACDCLSASSPVQIEVRGDLVQRVTDDVGSDVTTRPGMRWPTVDSLFALTQAMIEQETGTIEILFDTTYHYPLLAQAFNSRTGNLLRYSAAALTPVSAIVR